MTFGIVSRFPPPQKTSTNPQTCAFAAANFGLGVTQVYLTAIEGQSPAEARITLRRIRESLLKGCMLFGVPRMLNSFYPLAKAIPGEEYIDPVDVREGVTNPMDLADRGLKVFRNVYRDETDGILEPYRIAPELSSPPSQSLSDGRKYGSAV